MTLTKLTADLAAANLQSHAFSSPSGGTILVTQHGGRVLGAFTDSSADNLYWVNPELSDPASARQLLAGEHVLGGDRMWLAPERGLFFKGDKLADGVVTQPAIDPGNWLIAQKSATSIRLVNEFSAKYFHIPNAIIRGTVDRTIRLIDSPFAHNPTILPALGRTQFVGYEIASIFRLLEAPDDDLHFGLWFLIQLVVPHGGHLYIPTAGTATITGDYYEPTGPDYLRVTDTHVRFKLDSIDRHKIGIRTTEILGRAAFLSNSFPESEGAQATLVVRNFFNNPSAHYSDVPLHTPKGTHDSFQGYNHNTGPSGFGELEFHTPGICRAMAAGGGGDPVVTDTNQVWAFTGSRPDLIQIASRLLNLPPEVFAV